MSTTHQSELIQLVADSLTLALYCYNKHNELLDSTFSVMKQV